ncbi:MAG: 5'-nucleotidase C-terminal domain-containing protein [Solibacillus sp.]|uniref:5'-nucleotidase C-terminal domain-containing protein n=1 Tax=Solibacillus sp. TaxID=1909654 RepID=UPI003315A192
MSKKRKMYSVATVSAVTAAIVGVTGVSAETQIFKDVEESHPYYAGIQVLASAGIIEGFGDGTFKPDATITRGQAAKMIANVLKLDTGNVVNPGFTDVKEEHYYYSSVAALVSTGFIKGFADNTFRPNDTITHSQLLMIFENVASLVDLQEILKQVNIEVNPTKQLQRGELASVLAVVLTSSLPTPQPDPEVTPDPVPEQQIESDYTLSLMHFNDSHARVENFPKLMTAVNEVRKENPEALLLHAGDVFSGTLYFNEFHGKADLPFLNALKVDYLTLGNHEFDLGSSPEGHQALVDFIKGANFPVVSSNVDFSGDAKFTGLFSDLISSEPENGKIYSGIVKEINGEKVGIFGLTTAETESIASPGSVKFENYIEEAKKAVKAFEDKGVNKIIALTHIGFDDNALVDNDQELAKAVPGIDIIVGGHSHTQLDKPFIVDTNTVGEKKDATLIVQAYQYADYLGTLDVGFDENGVVVAQNGKLLKIADYADDAEGLKILAPFKEKVDTISSTEIGLTLTETLVTPRSSEGEGISVRSSETALGNIITDGMLAKAKQYTKKNVIMALQNGGGIRAEIPAGNVTTGQVITVLPFGNTLALMDVTGAELKAAFEHSVKDAPKEHGGFLHIAGAKLEYDSSKEVGARVVSLKYFDEATKAYVDIKDNETYTVATNAFTAKGGDNYEVFKKAYAENRVTDLGLSDWENLKEQLLSLKEVKYTTEGRITDVAAPKTK